MTAGDGAAWDYFGYSVGISGDSVIVGAYQDDDNGSSSGSAYVFTRSDGDWTQQAKLVATDAEALEAFEKAVDLDPTFAPFYIHYIESLLGAGRAAEAAAALCRGYEPGAAGSE